MGLEKFIQKEYDGMLYVKNWCFCYYRHWSEFHSFFKKVFIECYVLDTILGTGDTLLIKEVKPALMKLVLRGGDIVKWKNTYVI